MFTPKNPLPFDFCGRPPCPICFDWHDPNGETMTGREKYIRDLLGVAPAELSDEKIQEVEKLIQQIHEGAFLVTPEQEEDARRMQKWLEHNAKQKAKLKPVAKPQPVIDHIDVEKIQAAAEKAKAERDAQKKREWDVATRYRYGSGVPVRRPNYTDVQLKAWVDDLYRNDTIQPNQPAYTTLQSGINYRK